MVRENERVLSVAKPVYEFILLNYLFGYITASTHSIKTLTRPQANGDMLPLSGKGIQVDNTILEEY